VVTLEQLTASITHEVNQPVGAARNNVIAVRACRYKRGCA